MISEALELRAVKAEQGEDTAIFSFFMKGADVLRISDLSRVRRDNDGDLKGFQRKEIQSHVGGIVEYLDRGKVIFPNAIILALPFVAVSVFSKGSISDCRSWT